MEGENMQREIKQNTIIELSNNSGKIKFTILDVLGIGASCVAYLVEYQESDEIRHRGILKEYCPAYLGENCRDEKERLIISKDSYENFCAGIDNYKNVYKTITEYLASNASATNYHPTQIGFFSGNNTCYTLAACDYGKTYDRIYDTNLYSIIRIALSVTKAVEMYHNAGYLHLDIKPENIFILDEVQDLIKLFDYDSLTPIQDVKNRSISVFPMPGDIYVPELTNLNIRNIGITTDIYEIGAMIYLRLFGHAPAPYEAEHDFIYSFDDIELLNGVSPSVKHELEILLRKTVQISKNRRYSNTDELKKQLNKILSHCESKQPYLMNMPKWQPTESFIGRNDEIKSIKKHLDNDGYVFIYGMGGIGKSEIAKMFVKKYSSDYHTVQFCKYTNSLSTLTASLQIKGINNDEYKDFEQLVKEKNKILHMSDEHTLIIVDNYNVSFDEFLREFLPADNKSFKVIFTTRCTQASDYYDSKTIYLGTLPTESCLSLFCSAAETEKTDNAEKLLKCVDYNTLAIILMASVIKKRKATVDELLNAIDTQSVEKLDYEFFHEYDYETDNKKSYNKLISHLNTIFSISSLTDDEIEILKNMTLIPGSGIDLSDFADCCSLDSAHKSLIYTLCDDCWLNIDENIVYMHPMISDIIAWNSSAAKRKSYYELAEKLEEYCNPDYESHISVVMDRLAFAMQLERRYKEENSEKRVSITAKLGRMYMNIYDPVNAKSYLLKSEQMALKENVEYLLPYIYYFLAEFEDDFGTPDSAISYYKKSIKKGKSIKIRYYYIVLDSMYGLGKCYFENNNSNEAYTVLKKALLFAKIHRFVDCLSDIYELLAEVCESLNLSKDADKYKNLSKKLSNEDSNDNIIPEFTNFDKDISTANFDKIQYSIEKYLNRIVEQYGEDSPLYKDVARNRWCYYILNGDIGTGLRQLNEAIAFVGGSYGKDSLAMAELLSSACAILPLANEYETAFDFGKKAVEICEKYKSNSYICQEAKLHLASLYLMVGDSYTAEEYTKDIDLSFYSGKDALTDALNTLGNLFLETNNFNKLTELCTKALSYSSLNETDRFMAITLLAFTDVFNEDLDNAKLKLEDAKKILDKLNESYSKAYSILYHRVLAQVHFKIGEYLKATEVLTGIISKIIQNNSYRHLLAILYLERGLYYCCLGETSKSKQDYSNVEKIYSECHLPKSAYTLLYNNAATNYSNSGDFITAKEYLKKVLEANPNIVSDNTINAAMICSNIGYVETQLDGGDLEYAEKMLQRAISIYDDLGLYDSVNYCTIKHNLALLYVGQDKYKLARKIYQSIIAKQNTYFSNYHGEIFRYILNNYIFTLLNIDAKKVQTIIEQELPVFEKYCENNKSMFLDWLGNTGGMCRAYENPACIILFEKGEKYAEENGLENSIEYAALLNYIGAYLATYEEYGRAKVYFEQSKDLYEELGETDSEAYAQVINNLAETKERNLDSIIAGLAKIMMEEENNNE